MTDSIYRCPDDGFTTIPRCVACGRSPEKVLSGDRRRRLSKFISGALRHFPEDAGLELDAQGWTDYDDLASAVARKYDWADPEHVEAVVATDPKGRFELSKSAPKTRIRAAYGHSVAVDLGDGGEERSEESEIPDRLYHGTDPDNLDAILAEGLDSMNRNEVHLSRTPAEAREVGSRHASEPVVLEIDAGRMLDDGLRVSKRSEEVFTVDEVPPEYLDVQR